MENKVAIIVPYFGRFPEHFQQWLQSCKNNPEFTWLIFTDDTRMFDFPCNVIKKEMSFEMLRIEFEKKLGVSTALEQVYKLCDFKPLYGYLFSEYITDFSHWGYCDVDLIFGKLSHFIDLKMLQEYDKISVLGHLSIIRNKDVINELYKKCDYKSILQDSRSRIFDEVRFEPNINAILIENGFKVKKTIEYADIASTHYSFGMYQYISGRRGTMLPKYPLVFEYCKGCVYGSELQNGNIIKKEYAYVHFQKREITVDSGINGDYLLVPNKICQYQEITAQLIRQHSKDSYVYIFQKSFKRLKNAYKVRVKKDKRK